MKRICLVPLFFCFTQGFAAPCEPGNFSVDGQEPCTPCDVGTYQENHGAINCDSCPAGHIQPVTGQDSCDACIPGTYQELTGQITCLFCEAGTFADTAGSAECEVCPAGTYAPEMRSTSCTTCPPWTNSEEGASACSARSGSGCAATGAPPPQRREPVDFLMLLAGVFVAVLFFRFAKNSVRSFS